MINEYDKEYLESLIKDKKITEIKEYMDRYNLKISGNKIVPADSYYEQQNQFWDQRQLARR